MKRAFLILIVLLFAARLTVIFVNRAYHTPASEAAGEVRLTVSTGMPADQVISTLHDRGMIRSPALFKLLIHWKGAAGRIKAGEYAFRADLTPLQVMEHLLSGDIVFHKLTVPEGLTIEETSALAGALPFLSGEEFTRRSHDPGAIAGLDPDAEDLEGFLFPDTYFLTGDMSAGQLVDMMTDRFKAVFSADWLERTEALGFTVREIITLASLIEKETGLARERPLVSSVFHNRLKKNMLLQCDPTVIYAMKKAGVYRGRLLRADLEFDSPYNTYLFPRLPPGPIACPGREAIRAALYPEQTDYYYFVSRNDGSHAFSRSMAEHNRMVRRYRR
jgi:UPF0755 protein